MDWRQRPKQASTRYALWLYAFVGLSVIAVTAIVWVASHRYFVSEEIESAEGRLSLYRSTVLAEVERFEHLTQVLAVDPFVIAALTGNSSETLNERIANFAAAAGLDAIFLMDIEGLTIAASNAGTEGSFVGENYGFRPYFREARNGGQGSFYGIGATTGLPGYFIAHPVRAEAGEIIGVVALKISLAAFEESWRAAGEQVLLANDHDVIILSSDPAWRYRTLSPLTTAAREQIAEARQFDGQPLEALDWQAEGQRARIAGTDRLHVASQNLPHGWHLHYLASDDPAVTRAWLAGGAVPVLAALALILAQYLRGRRLGDALRRSEQEEAALRRANDQLAREIEDRRRAERRLDETREELERASRLAALGQLSASVTHELGQPIAAMRNYLAAHGMVATEVDQRLTGRMTGLVDRMEGITRQLKFFACSDEEAFETIDMRDCVAAALELLAPSFEAAKIACNYQRPEEAFWVRGSRLRLEQVLTNLLRNAVDAMEDSQDQMLQLRLGHEDGAILVEVSDTGHGLGEATLAELSAPFVTTRESGRGMGLGLAISSGIVEDHGGRLEAENRRGVGAVFRLRLPAAEPREMAAE